MTPESPSRSKVHIIGAGMAGSEAAYFLAQAGVSVVLHEMRPLKTTPAHHTENFAELVCSNSLKSQIPSSAPGMLKAEMNQIGSLILTTAAKFSVPAGEALAVDRELFSKEITEILHAHPNIQIQREEIQVPPSHQDSSSLSLLATGPLTTESLCHWIGKVTASPEDLYFYDAIAPIIDARSIDRERCFLGNRYDKGEEEAYLNCPMTESEYYAFIDALLGAEKVTPKNFEKEKFFQGCQPIEAIAATGKDSLRFGPMKPVGLTDPKTGQRPFAVVQLRPENRSLTAYNLVGFQTKLKYGEQSRILKMIPALHQAEFLRLGSIHRNTYVCAPRVLRSDLSIKGASRVYIAGQLSGVEGYLESSACGLLSALFILQRLRGLSHEAPAANTALGALLRHVTASDPKNYQPGNIHFGLFDPAMYPEIPRELLKNKDLLRKEISRLSLQNFKAWWENQSQSLYGQKQSSSEISSKNLESTQLESRAFSHQPERPTLGH